MPTQVSSLRRTPRRYVTTSACRKSNSTLILELPDENTSTSVLGSVPRFRRSAPSFEVSQHSTLLVLLLHFSFAAQSSLHFPDSPAPFTMSTSQHTLDKEPTRVEGGGLFPSQPSDHDAPHRAAQHRYSTEQPFLPVYHGSRFANPSPLAFTAVGVSLYLVGMVALKADGLQTLSIIVSTALGYSSVALLVAVSGS